MPPHPWVIYRLFTAVAFLAGFVRMAREQRAREVLYASGDFAKRDEANAVAAMLAFANAELGRAAHRCLEMADMIGAMPGSSIASALLSTSEAILDMRNDD